MSNEPYFSLKKMDSKYELIKSAIKNIDSQIILKILRETVDGYE